MAKYVNVENLKRQFASMPAALDILNNAPAVDVIPIDMAIDVINNQNDKCNYCKVCFDRLFVCSGCPNNDEKDTDCCRPAVEAMIRSIEEAEK